MFKYLVVLLFSINTAFAQEPQENRAEDSREWSLNFGSFDTPYFFGVLDAISTNTAKYVGIPLLLRSAGQITAIVASRFAPPLAPVVASPWVAYSLLVYGAADSMEQIVSYFTKHEPVLAPYNPIGSVLGKPLGALDALVDNHVRTPIVDHFFPDVQENYHLGIQHANQVAHGLFLIKNIFNIVASGWAVKKVYLDHRADLAEYDALVNKGLGNRKAPQGALKNNPAKLHRAVLAGLRGPATKPTSGDFVRYGQLHEKLGFNHRANSFGPWGWITSFFKAPTEEVPVPADTRQVPAPTEGVPVDTRQVVTMPGQDSSYYSSVIEELGRQVAQVAADESDVRQQLSGDQTDAISDIRMNFFKQLAPLARLAVAPTTAASPSPIPMAQVPAAARAAPVTTVALATVPEKPLNIEDLFTPAKGLQVFGDHTDKKLSETVRTALTTITGPSNAGKTFLAQYLSSKKTPSPELVNECKQGAASYFTHTEHLHIIGDSHVRVLDSRGKDQPVPLNQGVADQLVNAGLLDAFTEITTSRLATAKAIVTPDFNRPNQEELVGLADRLGTDNEPPKLVIVVHNNRNLWTLEARNQYIKQFSKDSPEGKETKNGENGEALYVNVPLVGYSSRGIEDNGKFTVRHFFLGNLDSGELSLINLATLERMKTFLTNDCSLDINFVEQTKCALQKFAKKMFILNYSPAVEYNAETRSFYIVEPSGATRSLIPPQSRTVQFGVDAKISHSVVENPDHFSVLFELPGCTVISHSVERFENLNKMASITLTFKLPSLKEASSLKQTDGFRALGNGETFTVTRVVALSGSFAETGPFSCWNKGVYTVNLMKQRLVKMNLLPKSTSQPPPQPQQCDGRATKEAISAETAQASSEKEQQLKKFWEDTLAFGQRIFGSAIPSCSACGPEAPALCFECHVKAENAMRALNPVLGE